MTQPRGPAGSAIQPFGMHIGLTGNLLIYSASANLEDQFPSSAAASIGQPMTALFSSEAIHDLRNRMAMLLSPDAIEHLYQMPLAEGGKPFDVSIYREGDGFAIDLEPSSGHGFGDATGVIQGMIARLDAHDGAAALCKQAAHQLRSLIGCDQVSIGLVGGTTGKSSRAGVEFGDIEVPDGAAGQAMIVDLDATPVDMIGADENDAVGRSILRAPPAAESEILRAAGVRATLRLPLTTRDGRRGQVLCCHATPRHVGPERRSIAALFADFVALRLEIAELRARA